MSFSHLNTYSDFNNDQNKGLAVRFFMLPVQDEARSQEEGRPIFNEREMVEIIIPGSKDITHLAVTDVERNRFPGLYKNFKEKNTDKLDGTPLSEFPFMSASERKELEYFHVFTGEQLINVSDIHKDKMGVNARDLIKKVEAYMKFSKDNAHLVKTTQENEELRREMNLLKEQMSNLLMKEGEDVQKRKK